MKILQINKFYFLAGGTERYMFGLSDILEKKGHEIIPFAMQDSRNLPSKYAKYFIKPVNVDKFSPKNIAKLFYNPDAARKLEKLIQAEKPDIAHLHNIAHQMSPAIINVLKKHNIPIIQTLHDYKLICPNYKLFSQGEVCYKCKGQKFYNCTYRKCLKNSRAKSFLAMLEAYWHNLILKTYAKVDLFIAPSRFMRDICVNFGVPENKIKVLHNPIDIEKSEENQNIEDYLLYFGRISSEKGIDVLIKAMQILRKDIKLKIVGDGPDLEKYKTQVKKLNSENKIIFLGPKYERELEELIEKAKAIIIPSIWPENMPYSLLESMAKGKTIIASRIGGLPELIKDNINGFLFKAGNVHDLKAKIDELNIKDLYPIGRKAKESLTGLSYASHTDSIVNLYKKFTQN